MKITEVRVKLLAACEGDEKLRGFCSITFDDEYVVRDIKIIEGARGLFVAMPSRRVTARCQRCGNKNHLRARFCNDCGVSLKVKRQDNNSDQGPARLFVDIAHPINQHMRQLVHDYIVEEFHCEVARSNTDNNSRAHTEHPSGASERHDHDLPDQNMEAGG
ncbi:MAG: stage V sporulation protein G [Planctomycetota bacterium]|jgi:stage V sporulation protein G